MLFLKLLKWILFICLSCQTLMGILIRDFHSKIDLLMDNIIVELVHYILYHYIKHQDRE